MKRYRIVPMRVVTGFPSSNAQTAPPSCNMAIDAATMVSWANHPGYADYNATRALSKGTNLFCKALADSGTPACDVKLQNGGEYTLPSHNAIRIEKDDFATLSCKGAGKLCCKVQLIPDSSPVKKKETKPHPEKPTQ